MVETGDLSVSLADWPALDARRKAGWFSWEVFFFFFKKAEGAAWCQIWQTFQKSTWKQKKRWEGSGEKSYFVLGKGHHHAIEHRAMVAVAKRSNGSGRVCIDTSPESLAAKREQVDGPTQIPWMNKFSMRYDLHDLQE